MISLFNCELRISSKYSLLMCDNKDIFVREKKLTCEILQRTLYYDLKFCFWDNLEWEYLETLE